MISALLFVFTVCLRINRRLCSSQSVAGLSFVFFLTPRGTKMLAPYLYGAYHYTIRSFFDVMRLVLSELHLSQRRKQPERL